MLLKINIDKNSRSKVPLDIKVISDIRGKLTRKFMIKINSNHALLKLEGTHRVRTHAVLLYPNLNLWLWNPKTMSFLGYPKVIRYTKFEYFEIIRFWVMLQTNKWKCTYWPCDLDLSTFKPYHFQHTRRSFVRSIPSLNTLRSFVFYLCSGQTDRQTSKRTRTSYPHQPSRTLLHENNHEDSYQLSWRSA